MRCTPLQVGGPEDGAAAALSSLWLCSLLQPPSPPEMACLSSAELARASRFLQERDRRRYLASHCALRQRLAQKLQVPAGGLRFVEGPHGKPHLTEAPACHFNLSHSDEWALIGLSDRCEIGVDIEALRPVSDADALARSNFTDLEYGAFMAVDPALRNDVFLRVWTRKEACMKALGTGFSLPPDSFSVGLQIGRTDVEIPWSGFRIRVAVQSVDSGVQAAAAVAWLV